MEKMTISEALAEIKLIKNKIAKKRQTIQGHLGRWENQADPFEKQGGAAKFLQEEEQAIRDLETRWVQIRTAISRTNDNTKVEVGGVTRALSDWLVWKREVVNDHVQFYQNVGSQAKQKAEQAAQNPNAIRDEAGNPKFMTYVPHVNYTDFLQKVSDDTEVLDSLDGKLSMKNATTFIEL